MSKRELTPAEKKAREKKIIGWIVGVYFLVLVILTLRDPEEMIPNLLEVLFVLAGAAFMVIIVVRRYKKRHQRTQGKHVFLGIVLVLLAIWFIDVLNGQWTDYAVKFALGMFWGWAIPSSTAWGEKYREETMGKTETPDSSSAASEHTSAEQTPADRPSSDTPNSTH